MLWHLLEGSTMRSSHVLAPLFAIAAIACSGAESAVAPRPDVTLSVTNETCHSGVCDSLVVLAFPDVRAVTPGGLWHLYLGTVTTPQACYTIPTTAKFLVIAVAENGSADTTTYRWSDVQSMSIGALAPDVPGFAAGPTTASFVPAAHAGWTLSVPSGTTAVSGPVCHP